LGPLFYTVSFTKYATFINPRYLIHKMSLAFTVTGMGFLQEGLRPLEYLDISKLYENYSVFIDFAIYLMVFVGISQI